MSSLARRSLRTTAAAAGIAALGVGLAGHAFAAPEAPALPGTDAVATPGAPNLTGGGEALSNLMDAPSTGDAYLPGVFNFEMPTVSQQTADRPSAVPGLGDAAPALGDLGLPGLPLAGPEAAGLPTAPALPAAPAVPAAPAAPGGDMLDSVVNTGGGLQQFHGPEVDPASFMDNNQVGAMSGMDTAAMFADMIQKAMAGDSVTQGNAIGS